MKIVKTYLYEKFKENSDPIHDMSVGLYVDRNFNTQSEFIKFLIDFLPFIVEEPKIPHDILYTTSGHTINNKYFNIIQNYLLVYVTFLNKRMDDPFNKMYWWTILLREELEKLGFKSESGVNEKFTEESDPIYDMSIGIKHLIENWIKSFSQEHEWLYHKMQEDWKITNNCEIDVKNIHDDCDISYTELDNLPYYIKFGEIDGDFMSCLWHKKTLKHYPNKVNGNIKVFCPNYKKYNTNIIKESDIRKVCDFKDFGLYYT